MRLRVRLVGEALLLSTEDEGPGYEALTAALPVEDDRLAVVCSPLVTARESLFRELPDVLADEIGGGGQGIRLVLLGERPAAAETTAAARALADQIGVAVTVPLEALTPGAQPRWVTCRPGDSSVYEPAWIPLPAPASAPSPQLSPDLPVSPDLPEPLLGRATVAGLSFLGVATAIGEIPAVAGTVVEIAFSEAGFVAGGRARTPAELAAALAGREGAPIILIGPGIAAAAGPLDPRLGELADRCHATVIAADADVSINHAGTLSTTGSFRAWHPDSPSRNPDGTPVAAPLGPTLPVEATMPAMIGRRAPGPSPATSSRPHPENPPVDPAPALPAPALPAPALPAPAMPTPAMPTPAPVSDALIALAQPRPHPHAGPLTPPTAPASAAPAPAGNASAGSAPDGPPDQPVAAHDPSAPSPPVRPPMAAPALPSEPAPVLAPGPAPVPQTSRLAAMAAGPVTPSRPSPGGTRDTPAARENAPAARENAPAARESAQATPENAQAISGSAEATPENTQTAAENAAAVAEQVPAAGESRTRPAEAGFSPHKPLWITGDDWGADDRTALRETLNGRYDMHARMVTRTLAEEPGLRSAGGSAELVAGLVALRAYGVDDRQAVNRALRGSGAADARAVLVARGAAYGMRRLPAVLGPVFRPALLGEPGRAAYRPGTELVEPGFLDVELQPHPRPGAGWEFVIWSVSARRLGRFGPPDTAAALFPPGTRFRVLAVEEGEQESTPTRVLLCDVGNADRGGPLGAANERVLTRLRDASRRTAAPLPCPDYAADAPGLDPSGRPYARA